MPAGAPNLVGLSQFDNQVSLQCPRRAPVPDINRDCKKTLATSAHTNAMDPSAPITLSIEARGMRESQGLLLRDAAPTLSS